VSTASSRDASPRMRSPSLSSVRSDQDVFTVAEAARFLRIGRNQLYSAISRGAIPHRRIGRSIRLSRIAVVQWLEGSR
jgi:excisionase family DNA binding protein